MKMGIAMLKILGIAALLLPLSSSAFGQFRGFGAAPQEYYDSNLQVATSRPAAQLFENARRDLESGETERAVRYLQQILDEHGSAAHLATTTKFEGVRDHAHSVLASLPAKGLETYRRIFDPYAKELYDRGLAEFNAELLLDVHRRYFHTSYGKRALVDAMDIELATGRFNRAVGLALLVHEAYPLAVELRARATATAAIAASASGDAELLAVALKDLPDAILDLEIEIAGRRRSVRALVEEVKSELPTPTLPLAPSAESLLRPRWSARVPMRSRGTESAGQLIDFRRSARHRYYAWNPVLPVLDEGTVYVSNGVEIRALGLYGQAEKWTFQGPAKQSQARVNLSADFPLVLDGNLLFGSLEIPVDREQQIWNYTPQMAVPERRLHALDATTGRLVWSQARYEHAEADSKERFFVNELSVNSRPIVIGDDLFVSATRFHTSYHHYVCCFDRNSGRLRWATFVCTGQMEQNMFGNRIRESLSGHLVMKGGVLWYATNIGVVAAVDARLGTLRQALRYEQIGIPRQQRIYRSVFERGPAWANNEPIVAGDRIYFTPLDSQSLIEVDTTTFTARAVLERNEKNRYRYIVGPVDGRIVLLGTGVDYWNLEERRLESSRIRLEAGSVTEDRGAGVVGKPLLIGKTLFAPVRYRPRGKRALADRIFVWDLATRKLTNEINPNLGRGDIPLAGNLATNGEAFVIAATDDGRNLTFVHGFFNEAELLARLSRRMKSDPDDPEPHFQFGEILVQSQSEDLAGIVSAFERAKTLAEAQGPGGRAWVEKSREALYRLYIQLAAAPVERRRALNLDEVNACFERALANAGSPGQKIDVLFRLLGRSLATRDQSGLEKAYARILKDFADEPYDHREEFSGRIPAIESFHRYPRAGLPATVIAARLAERQGRFAEAVAHYQTIIRDYATEALGSDTAWRWARDRISELMERQGANIYAAEESRAAQLFADGRKAESLNALQSLLELYPNSSFAPRAHLEVARRQIASGRAGEAVSSIAASLARFEQPSGELLVGLARALESAGLSESARQAWAYARVQAPRDLVEENGKRLSVLELADAAATRLPLRPSPATPKLSFTLNEAWQMGEADGEDDWALVEAIGVAPASFAGHFFAFRGGRLYVFDAAKKEPRWHIDCESLPIERLYWQDGRLIGLLDNQFVALNPQDGKEYWRAGVEGRQLGTIATGQGRVYGIVQPHSLASRFRLQARSLFDGALIYDLAFDGVPPSQISVGEQWLVMALDAEPQAWILDPFTGTRAPGFPSGLRFDEVMPPFLGADDLVVAVPEASKSEERTLQGIDPRTGTARWTRRLGAASVRFWGQDHGKICYRLRDRDTNRSTIVVTDMSSGASLLEHELGEDIMLIHGSRIAESHLYAVLSRPTRPGSSLRTRYVEAFEFGKGSTRWRSAEFGRSVFALAPFEKGLLVNVLERVRTSGRRRSRLKSTLNLLDGTNGSAKSALEPSSEDFRYSRNMVLILDGKLVVADGPILKVYNS
jgi:outer membrane protein assembly factor BamB